MTLRNTNSAQKLLLREIFSVEPAIHTPLRYNDVPISFSREGHWTSFTKPGKFPLVLDPAVQGSKLTRVLIDSGSRLKPDIREYSEEDGAQLMSFLTPIYSIVLGNSSTPIGSVTLPITIGTEQNFRTEHIK